MPTGTRHRFNGIFGSITDNPLTSGAGSFNSAGLTDMGVISVPDHVIITLDPLKQYGAPEIVIVTSHTTAATVASVTRGAYGTTARAHPQGTLWVHAPLDEDFMEIGTTAGRPTNPYFGQPYFNTTLNAMEVRDTVPSWQNVNMLADPPSCRIFHNASQSPASGVLTALAFNSERYDTAAMHDTLTNNSRITMPTVGVYLITSTYVWANNAVGFRATEIVLNGATTIAISAPGGVPDAGPVRMALCTTYKFAANDYVELKVFQSSGGPLAVDSSGNFSPEFSATWIGRG